MSDATATPMPGPVSVVNEPRWMVPLALFALYVIWGSTYLGIRYALVSYPPFLLAAIRFAVAGVLLFAVLRIRGAALPTARQWRNAAFVGTLLLAGGNGLVCFAEQSVSSGIAAVAVASMPLFAAVFGGIYREWPTRGETIGLLLGFAGVIVLNLGAGLSGAPLGAIALIVAAMSWAFGSVWSKRQDMPSGPMNTAAQMLCASVSLAIIALLRGERFPPHPEPSATFALAYLIVFGSIVAFSAYLYVLKTVRPALATSYAYVNPPVAVLFGVLLAGEHVGVYELAGMAIILVGVGIITMMRVRKA
ncbi:Permease of the drug/metabolite transporter (DMT) superfamily [Luteibacter sp. UNCMF331Sha3.1]|uniref:drug/metabolite exporter YedA n=1 Tax=Luteibacter sp. UNCMF331Sha3.1 TaxID=1502760 RepID=UPI0008D6CE1B|nr:drug/metabolite exporter YedA [Luteibacter sp. UNCMF331Sha3.1]SEM40376.1 Permease of the drug/metabolite transporter (DMT) superfamily [Luteibacter sp. UNCMF331Sha3.1]